jgi:hypothetical protein
MAAGKTKKTPKAHRIGKKRNGRFWVKNTKNKPINGEEKVKILVGAGLIKAMKPKEKPAE